MNRSLLILFLLVFMSACTVQKRLHRPGWNVNWNKNYKQNRGSDKLDEVENKEAIESNLDQIEFDNSGDATKEEEVTESPEPTSEVLVTKDEIENTLINTSIENKTSTEQTISTNSEKTEDSKKKKWRTNYSVGIFFAALSLLCTALILRINTSIVETPDQGISNIVMSGVLVIIGLPSFILAIVLFCTPSPKDKKIKEPKKIEEAKEMTEKDKKEAEKMSKRTTYALLVFLALLILLFVLIALNQIIGTMNRSLFILLLFAFTSACTVQKRLHRPGWHVNWNKNYKQNRGSEALEEKSTRIELTQEEEISSFEHESNSREEENQHEQEYEQLESTASSEYLDQPENEITTDTIHTPSERDAYISTKASEKSKTKTRFGSHHVRSIVLFLFFLLCALGIIGLIYEISLAIYFISVLLLLVGVVVLIILSFIFLIGAIIALFSNSKSLPKNRASTDRTEEKEENKSPDQEQSQELKTEKTKQENTTEKPEKTSKTNDIIGLSIFAIAAILIFFLIYY